MVTFPAKGRTSHDGTLSLAIPTGLPDADVDVLVVLESATPSAKLLNHWPAGYFDEFCGALRGEDVIRHPQGLLEDREPIN